MKIKVLHMIHSLVNGGAEKQMRLLVNNMDTDKFSVSVFCVKDIGNDIDSEAIKVIVAKQKNPFTLEYIREIKQAIKACNPDIVHIWLPASVAIPSLWFAFLNKAKIIFSYRGRMYFNRGLCYPEFLMVMLFADRIISNHKIDNSNILYKGLFKIKQGSIINNAVVVPESFRKLNYASNSQNTKFIFMGRLSELKNPLIVIEAFSHLRDNPDWHLDIYGKGELEQDVQDLITRQGLNSRIFLKGFAAEPYKIMQEADCLLFPSISEGMPNVLVEAFAIGLPVIASDIQGNRHIVEQQNAVIWINPVDVNSIIQGIENFIAMSRQSKAIMLENARCLAMEYTLEAMVNHYEKYYESMSQ